MWEGRLQISGGRPVIEAIENRSLQGQESALHRQPCKALARRPQRSIFDMLRSRSRAAEGAKKVFIRSGIRYDYLLEDPDDTNFSVSLIKHHVSGQLKVAPEHCSAAVLDKMGKPHIEAYIDVFRRNALRDNEGSRARSSTLYLISCRRIPGSKP